MMPPGAVAFVDAPALLAAMVPGWLAAFVAVSGAGEDGAPGDGGMESGRAESVGLDEAPEDVGTADAESAPAPAAGFDFEPHAASASVADNSMTNRMTDLLGDRPRTTKTSLYMASDRGPTSQLYR